MTSPSELISQSSNSLASLLSDAIEQNQLEVPMLPTVATRVITLTQDPDTDARHLSDLIQGDQSLAAYVMKIANSPAYTPDGNLVSLQQAIARLGMKNIAEIAITASVNSKTFAVPEFESEISLLWDHSLATALWSKEIARICRKNVECVFLCGLLHSIGKPAALQKVVELANRHQISTEPDLCMKLVDQFHRKIGIEVVQKWAMPKAVVDVLSNFDDYRNSEHSMEPTAIVVTGSAFATYMLQPELISEKALVEMESLEIINLYDDEVEALLAKYCDIRSSMETMRS
ncbi:MAG: HDOD domain-containing protein [Planctomycetota bacterium]|nr:HDOD domain-containing protein [Planctomycetota bacterium]